MPKNVSENFVNLNDVALSNFTGNGGKVIQISSGLKLEAGQDLQASASPTFSGLVISSVTSGNVLSSNGTAFVGVTPDSAGLVDKATDAQIISGSKIFSDYQDLSQISVPANPASGTRRLFVDSATGKLSVRTSAGATVSLEESGGNFNRAERLKATDLLQRKHGKF